MEKKETNEIRVVIAGMPDSGKCLAKDTEILLFNNTVIHVQDITVGDILMGDDGDPRIVHATSHGEGMLWQVLYDPINEDSSGSYVVNYNHILTLKDSENFTVDIPLRDFLTFSERKRRTYRGFQMLGDFVGCHTSRVHIIEYGHGEYFGFELDGNGRFLLGDRTVTHNSSLIGSLTSGELDDGRGKARESVFNYNHEIKTGRTSSISQHLLGFDEKGEVVNYGTCTQRKKSWPVIVEKSEKLVSVIDLCGHEKYLRTTIHGFTSQYPDMACILVGANMGIGVMTKEHIFLCLALQIPFCILVTKIDICDERKNVLEETIMGVKKLIQKSNRKCYSIQSEKDAQKYANSIHKIPIVPMFHISSVTGQGLDYFRCFLSNVPHKLPEENTNKVEFHIDSRFTVKGIGAVYGGMLRTGTIRIGDTLLVGPINGEYHSVSVRTIHYKRTDVESVNTPGYVCVSLGKSKKDINIHRGCVMIHFLDEQLCVTRLKAEISVLLCHTTIKPKFQAVLSSGNIRTTTVIESIENLQSPTVSFPPTAEKKEQLLRTGDRAIITVKFPYASQYIKVGAKILLSEGRVKVCGKVTEIEK